ncbi:FmdE family protein [Thermodesulforhabdus norvegica]|uniref:Formylmethanofuran dehydrogenase subunit E n=1 Tax=Thermodesulforhabdus norvegica TaxID=39841 RepID=A0A1I4S3L2_9BACT|nr:FmdE family protein [Thermodesulforhabdus norvegica]SFM59088.1 formylmethanofuran dehydrogenase subunit E [Thermodesulforhabdus norvegica]
MKIGPHDFDRFIDEIKKFHGSVAPGVVIGGYMVEVARQSMPENVLYNAIVETRKCLPDAVQLLTPCTLGNGRLRVIDLGRFALSLYDRRTGRGVRVSINMDELDKWSEIRAWLLKIKPKSEQDTSLLLKQIREAGHELYRRSFIRISDRFKEPKINRQIGICPQCGEPYPAEHGRICKACQGESPYVFSQSAPFQDAETLPFLCKLPLQLAVGHTALHDMTQIVPGVTKGAAITRGQKITAKDLCRLQHMGRRTIYVACDDWSSNGFIHEDEAALAFAEAMAGPGVRLNLPAREGKINLFADRDGLLVVEEDRLEQFNMIEGVMCASRKGYVPVNHNEIVAGTRAIPLFLARKTFDRAMAVLEKGPFFKILPLRPSRVGIVITGNEVFEGLIQDSFTPLITAKVERFQCRVIQSCIVPDDRLVIRQTVLKLIDRGAELIVVTAGLSVDPDDVTRCGLIDAGAEDIIYGAPILPGAMTLIARIGDIPIIGVPACALYFKTTSFDLLLPRLLAGIPVTRKDLARLGHGGLCLNCKTCTYPRCSFGR